MRTLVIAVAIVALLGIGVLAYAHANRGPAATADGYAWCHNNAADQYTGPMGHHGMVMRGHQGMRGPANGQHHAYRGHRWQNDSANGHPGADWCPYFQNDGTERSQ